MGALTSPLSLNETILLRSLAMGDTADEIAIHFRMRKEFVVLTLQTARAKLGARTETQAVAIAVTQGWLNLRESYNGQEHIDFPNLLRLTSREKIVFDLLGSCETADMSAAELADELVLSESTLRRHLYNIYHKLGVRGRVGAAFLAAGLPIIPRGDL